RVDKLYVDPQPFVTAQNTAFKNIAHVQFTADPLGIDSLALEGERGVAGDNERASYPRQVRGEGFGDAVDKIVLAGVGSKIGERQHDDREPRRTRFFGGGDGCSVFGFGAE